MRKINLRKLGVLLMLIALSTAYSKDKRPNIVIILCDDLGYNDVGFNGSKDIKTPNLDKLADNGMIMTAGYVAHPFCGPSRTSIMTGKYAHTMGAQFNIPSESEGTGYGIPLNNKFISKELQEAGYYTGAFGKWHLGADTPFHPNKRGFDEFYGFLGGGHDYIPEQYKPKYEFLKQRGSKNIRDYIKPLEHNGTEVDEKEYITDGLSREAVNFVYKASEKKQPFFMYLAYNAPHVPLQAKKEDMAVFKSIKDEKRRTYAAMVYAVDRGVGKLVEALKANQQLENTLLVFFSDNGGKLGKGANNFPLTEGKGSAYEGGHRVPMFFHWPNRIKAGQKFHNPVSALDLYPTFASLAKTKPSNAKNLAGTNILPHLQKGTNPHKDEMLYIVRHRTGLSDVGARLNEWKVVRTANKPWKLFYIKDDISESKDRSSEFPNKLKAMVKQAEAWSKTNAEPLWFHAKEEGQLWKEYHMPRFNETFSLN
ncbi:sulfatase family protein [Ochrovirga pacifica]|uniref:sulfatase family protein n=1 Tax=Ochrovirga pacifica TaxID=1042376 RepID=UPI000255837D|nr:sulfatase-like hydrolase/transferase [Ochrovirga pacifica]